MGSEVEYEKILKGIIKAIAANVLSIATATVMVAAICVLFFTPKDPVLDSLLKYEKKEYYTSGGFQDFPLDSFHTLLFPYQYLKNPGCFRIRGIII